MHLTSRQLATALAALRYYQSHGLGDPANRPQEIHEIVTNFASLTSLDAEGIDDLCEGLNCATAMPYAVQMHGAGPGWEIRETIIAEFPDFESAADYAQLKAAGGLCAYEVMDRERGGECVARYRSGVTVYLSPEIEKGARR